MQGRVVTRAEIERALPGIDAVAAMERAFTAYSAGRAVVPPVGELLFRDPPGDAHIKYGYIEGDAVFVVKIATGFYENTRNGLPPNSGVLLVFDARTGLPGAVLLDEGHLTNVRTAAAGAMAAKYLAPKDIAAIGILGAGIQARMQAIQLKAVVSCRKLVLWARRSDAALACAADLEAAGFAVGIAESPAAVARAANLIVTVTPAMSPLLDAAAIRPGTHITAVGSDTEEKRELAADAVAKADLLVADSIPQCAVRGELHHALAAGAIERGAVVELGHIVSGAQPGRKNDDQITIADLTGVAVQDIEIAKAVLARLN